VVVFVNYSLGKLGNFLVDSLDAGVERHVHEFGFSVHLEAAEDVGIHLVLNGEFFAFVLGVLLEGEENLVSLSVVQLIGRDNSDLLFLVELRVQFLVLLSNLLNENKSLVLSEHCQEVHSEVGEGGGLQKSVVQKFDFLSADTLVLGEHTEVLAVGVQLAKVNHILKHVVKGSLLGGGNEKNAGVSAFDGVFLAGGFVIGGRVDFLDVSEGEGLEKVFGEVEFSSIDSLGGSLDGLRFDVSGFSNGLLFFGRLVSLGLSSLFGEGTHRGHVGVKVGGGGSSGEGAGHDKLMESTGVEGLKVVGDHILLIINYYYLINIK